MTDNALGIAVPSEIRQHWCAVAACFLTAVFAWGFGFYSQSIYLSELHRLRGWSSFSDRLGDDHLLPFRCAAGDARAFNNRALRPAHSADRRLHSAGVRRLSVLRFQCAVAT